MSWADVDKPNTSSNAGRFITFEEDKVVRMRFLDDEPLTTYVHKISQDVGGESVFRTIPATPDLDDDWIEQNSNRWPAQPVYNLRAFVYTEGLSTDDDEITGDFKVLQGGKQIFKQLKQIFDRYGSIQKFDIEIVRKGEGRDSEYFVNTAPESFDLDIESLAEGMKEDEAMGWEALFPPITPERQQEIFEEAGFDIAYDPAAELAAEMTLEEAKKYKFEFGKHKGRSVGEVMVLDAGWLKWGASNITSNDLAAASCRVAVENLDNMDKRVAAPKSKQVGSGAKKTAAPKKEEPKASAKKTTKAAPSGPDRDALYQQANQLIGQQDLEPMDVINLFKKHSGGKTRLKDFNAEQLQSLIGELS